MNIQGNNVLPLPEDLQYAIVIGHEKVNALRDQEINITRSKETLLKEMALLELQRDDFIRINQSLSVEQASSEDRVKEIRAELEKVNQEFSAVTTSLAQARKEESKSIARTIEESSLLSQIVANRRSFESQEKAEKEELQRQINHFEARKNAVRDILNTI